MNDFIEAVVLGFVVVFSVIAVLAFYAMVFFVAIVGIFVKLLSNWQLWAIGAGAFLGYLLLT
jgi:hypothetical protein